MTTATSPDLVALRTFALEEAERQGFDVAGVAPVEASPRLAGFGEWIASGRAGTMDYLARRNELGRYLREEVTAAWPWARSVLCAALVYNTLTAGDEPPPDGERGWISRYAWGTDYHRVLGQRLEAWRDRVAAHAPADAQFKLTVDTAPLVEREAARQAGLGWQAKNTCLIHPRLGSWFFLGCMVTSLDLAAAPEPLPDRCGSCTRCIEACPTQALEPYHMDATRCLAYLNIELRGSIPEPFRAAMGNNILGCDICQQVCPWNQPRPDADGMALRAPLSPLAEFQPRPGLLAPQLAALAALTELAYQEKFRHSAVKRAKWQGLRRNIAIAMGNSGNREFISILKGWECDADPVLSEHARWALSQLCASEPAEF